MNLNTTYTSILQGLQQLEVTAAQELPMLTREQLKERTGWLRGLVLLDLAATQLPENKETVYDFYLKLITENLDFKASVYLDDEDYDFYFRTIMEVLHKLAPHFPEVYTQIAFQYREARRNYRDAEKTAEYLDKAIAHNIPMAIAVKGYFLYYGILLEEDQKTGLELLNSSDHLWNQLYRGYIALGDGERDSIPALIATLKSLADAQSYKSVLLFEAHYYDVTEDLAAATAAYKRITDEYETGYSLFRLGTIKFAEGGDEASRAEAFSLWQQAFEMGTIDGAVHLGYHQLPESGAAKAFEPAIHWFQLAYLYNNAYAAHRLALIYLYAPEMIDIEKGMHYLDEAILNESADAILDKAEMLLEGALISQDEPQAFALFQKAADKKIPYALNRMGYFYDSGLLTGEAPNPVKALALYEAAAEQNFPGGINNAGRIYRYGDPELQDIKKAQEFFERGVAANAPYSMIELAIMHEDDTLERDYQKAFDLYHQAATLDYPYAIQAVGNYLENGFHNQNPDLEAAFEWFKKGAELEDANCQYETGRCYRYGVGVAENPDEAIAYYTKSAEAGNPKAMVELGLCHEYEYGVAFDAHKAMDYMQQAADLGYYFGEYKLGFYYMHGLVEQDTQKGLEWLEKAAIAGYPYAMLEIGDYYVYDYDGIDQSEKAFDYYQRAYELDVIHQGMGLCYEYGIGVEANMSEAFKYYQMAADRDYVIAMYHTGRCYLEGEGVKANDAEAFRWFYDAAQRNNLASQYYAGSLLLKGKGVAMNKEEGLDLLQKAAAEEYAPAQFDLGNCYLMGDGVEEDEDTAMYWFEQAAENGHEKAMKLTGKK